MQIQDDESRLISENKSYELNSMERNDPGLIRWQLDSDDILSNLTADLSRKFITKDGKLEDISINLPVEVQKEDGSTGMELRSVTVPALMNALGIKDMITFLMPYLSKNMYLSEFDKFEIAEMVLETNISVIGTLYINHKMYQIDKENLDIVRDIMIKYTYSAAKRAEKGGERKFITSFTKTIEHKLSRNENEQEQQKSSFWNWGRGK